MLTHARARAGVGYHRFALNAESTLCAWHERDREASRSESHVYLFRYFTKRVSRIFYTRSVRRYDA